MIKSLLDVPHPKHDATLLVDKVYNFTGETVPAKKRYKRCGCKFLKVFNAQKIKLVLGEAKEPFIFG